MGFGAFLYYCFSASLFLTMGVLNLAILIRDGEYASMLNLAAAVVSFTVVFVGLFSAFLVLPS